MTTTRTKLEELLDVQRGEKFLLNDRDGEFCIYNGVTLCTVSEMTICGSELLGSIICGMVKIIHRPTLTDEQRKVLEALNKLGYGWIARNQSESIIATTTEPYKCGVFKDEWTASGEVLYLNKVVNKTPLPLLPDWTKPLNIKEVLGK